MRPIKFRAWHKIEGCMYFTQSLIGMKGEGWIQSIDFDGEAIQLGCEADEGDYVRWERFADVELMQFTGLHDKNGEEIYKGDIIKLEGWSPSIYMIDFDRGAFYIAKADRHEVADIKYAEECEVIGNIYENPELLK